MRAGGQSRFWTTGEIAAQLTALGIGSGDTVLLHAALKSVGPMIDGPDTLIRAILEAVGETGTLMAYTDWGAPFETLRDAAGRVPDQWRDSIAPFDPATSRANRDNGAVVEFVRTFPGARRSANPASFAAIGARAGWLTAEHPLDYGYGPGSPLARLVEAGGKVLMAGAPLDTMTLLHHAEHLADIPGKRVIRFDAPILRNNATEWLRIEEFNTGIPVVAGLPDDYFATVVEEYLATGAGARGPVGDAPSVLVDAEGITAFAVDWLEARFGGPR